MEKQQAPLAITLGDPAGIGPEIIVKAFRDAPELTSTCFVAGDVPSLRRAMRQVCAGEVDFPIVELATLADLGRIPPRCLPVLQVAKPRPLVSKGQVSAAGGRMAADCVRWAAQAALRGEVSGLVTAPLHKEALAAAGERFPGHTELLQAEAAAFTGVPVAEMPVRMMLANDELRTVLVSIHVSLREAIEAVTYVNVLETLRITHRTLNHLLGRKPRIAVAGLNPHAGEAGLFGTEELETIAPAIQASNREGILASGPYPPDTVFMRARAKADVWAEFDVVVAMYHDQGLIPVKYLGIEKGVNITLGLPILRTSPDHGTAFDIAGTGNADATSLMAAIRMARQLLGNSQGC